MTRYIFVSCLLIASTAAMALTPEENEFLKKQDRLQRELIDLKMQVQVLEQKAKIADLERKIRGQAEDITNIQPISQLPSSLGAPNVPPGVVMPPPPLFAPPKDDKSGSTAESGDIKLISVFGDPANLEAEVLERGVRIRVSQGYKLQSGWVVSKIETTRLTLKRGKDVKTVGY